MERSKIIIIGLLIINLIVMISYGNAISNKIDERYNDLQHNNSNLMNQLNNLEYSVKNTVEHIITSQADGISDYRYKIDEVDYEKKLGMLDVEVTLKEIAPQAQILAVIKADSGAFEDEIVLEQVSGLTYSMSTLISIYDNYQLHIYENLANGQSKKLNVQELAAPIYDDVYADRVQGISQGTSGTVLSSDTVVVDFTFKIKEPDAAGREVDKVALLVRHQQQDIIEIDLTDNWDSSSESYLQYMDEYKLKRASGIIDDTVTLEDYIEQIASDPIKAVSGKPNSFYIQHTFQKDELEQIRNWNDDMNESLIEYRLKFSFKDGYSFEL